MTSSRAQLGGGVARLRDHACSSLLARHVAADPHPPPLSPNPIIANRGRRASSMSTGQRELLGRTGGGRWRRLQERRDGYVWRLCLGRGGNTHGEDNERGHQIRSDRGLHPDNFGRDECARGKKLSTTAERRMDSCTPLYRAFLGLRTLATGQRNERRLDEARRRKRGNGTFRFFR